MCFPKFLASVGSLELLSTYRQEFREDVLPAEKISPENLFIPGKAQHKQSQGHGFDFRETQENWQNVSFWIKASSVINIFNVKLIFFKVLIAFSFMH